MRCPACYQLFEPTVQCAHCRYRFTASTWWQEAAAVAGGLVIFAGGMWFLYAVMIWLRSAQ